MIVVWDFEDVIRLKSPYFGQHIIKNIVFLSGTSGSTAVMAKGPCTSNLTN
jgi:hypothetical protein